MKHKKNVRNQGRLVVSWLHRGWQTTTNYFLPPQTIYQSLETDLDVLLLQGRDRILTVMLRLSSLLGTAAILALMSDLLNQRRWDLVVVYLIGMIIIGLISYLRQINYVVRALTFLGILYLLGVTDLSFFGVAEDWRLYFSSFTILATLFLGWRIGLAALFLSMVSFILIAWQISIGNIVITASAIGSPVPDWSTIIAFSLVFFLINVIVISAITTLLSGFENATQKERLAATSLRQKTDELEKSLIREKELTHEVVFALQREEELNRLRSKIITTISHEFRTPLTVINNSASLLDKYYEQLSDTKRKEQHKRIRQSIISLTELLQGVSTVERTKSEAVHPQQESIQFGQLCQRLNTELRQETAVPPSFELQILGDETKELVLDYYLLKQVIYNLLTNAFKYSAPGLPVQLHLACDTNLSITVIDQGIGIPEDDKEKIWELFYRGSNVDSRNGLGIGLYIVSQLLETMAGTITQADNPVGGTIFSVQLPIMKPTS